MTAAVWDQVFLLISAQSVLTSRLYLPLRLLESRCIVDGIPHRIPEQSLPWGELAPAQGPGMIAKRL
jgi:hypothetical protein